MDTPIKQPAAKISNEKGQKLGMRMIHRFVYLLVCTLFFFSACATQKVFLAPPSDQIEEIEGYASLRVTTHQQTARSRVSFLFSLPTKGRIDVFDPFGRVHYQLFIVHGEAFFVVPAKKVYWQGQEKEILEKLFGFHLSLPDVVGLMSGYWARLGPEKTQEGLASWTFLKNRKGWIQSGKSGEFFFEVQKYFGQTPWVQEVVFFHPQTEGRLKILDVNFNQRVPEETFVISFTKRYSQKTWEEIREILSNAR